jgi:hypothetical protein
VVELVEMELAQPTVQGRGLRRQAPKTAEIFDGRPERGHDTGGIIVKLDRARQARHPRLYRDLPRVNRERSAAATAS